MRLIQALIRLYQILISPLLGVNCRFIPTCSHYAQEAVKKHGAAGGIRLAAGRLAKCHPFSGKSGYDPVPPPMDK